MEKPKIPSREELDGGKRKERFGFQKHVYMSYDVDSAISDYAKRLKISQSAVIERIYHCGIEKFEKQNGFRLIESIPLEKRKKTVDEVTREVNERFKRVVEARKRNSAETANKLSDAYMKKILFDWTEEGSKDWESE